MGAEKRERGTRKTFVTAMVVLTAIMLALPAAALALPSQTPDNTPMIEGRVRAIEQVGNNIWLGGRFTQVKQRNGTVLDNVGNVAVLNSQTNTYRTDFAPDLGGQGTEVWDIQRYGGTGPHATDLLIAGRFAGPSDDRENLALVDSGTGNVIRWYDSVSLKSVLPAPNLSAPGGDGRVYGGGVSLSAFDFDTGEKLWTKSKTSVDPDIRNHSSAPAYRDLLLDGRNIWAACVCDAIDGNRAKALIKLNLDGTHVRSWYTEAGAGAFGEAVLERDGKLYLGAGGSDFVAQYGKNNGGASGWRRDTSGSTQALTTMDNKLVVGGHFFEVGDGAGDRCGKGRPGDVDGQGNPRLDPNNECKRRQGIAAYTFGGVLDPNWHPAYSGGYSLVWALHNEGGTRLHTGGEFKTVNGVVQNSYARFS